MAGTFATADSLADLPGDAFLVQEIAIAAAIRAKQKIIFFMLIVLCVQYIV